MNSKSKAVLLTGSKKIELNQKGVPKPINSSLVRNPIKILKIDNKIKGKSIPKLGS